VKVTTPFKVSAADTNSRTISGRILEFGVAANASTGKVLFEKGSVEPALVKLNLEHQSDRPIGRAIDISLSDDQSTMDGIFKIANTTAGSDSLVEAQDGLRDGFSIEVEAEEYSWAEDGTLVIAKGTLTGVALTHNPAFKNARVEEVAAKQAEEEAPEVSESAVDTENQPTTEGDEVENTAVNEGSAVEAVEATQSIKAAAPIVGGSFTNPRLEFTAAKYVENTIRAAMGDEDARQYVRAADNTTDNAGLVPTRQLSEVVNGLSTLIRPSIDAISRGALPDAGMTFEIPKITVAPTVAVTAEDGTPSETDQNSAFISVDVKTFSGQQTFSTQILDRSSPAFFEELVRNMAAAKAKAENAYVSAALVAAATSDGTTTTTYPTAAELLGVVARGAASVYGATAGLPNGFAKNIIMGVNQWANVMQLNDSGRPIYMAQQPQNAGGVARPDSLRGTVAGLDLFVDPSLAATDADGTILIVNPDAYTWYEGNTYRLRADVVASGQITIGYYGYGALATKIAAGAFKNNKA
jgi:HK97 family phage major capsid protein